MDNANQRNVEFWSSVVSVSGGLILAVVILRIIYHWINCTLCLLIRNLLPKRKGGRWGRVKGPPPQGPSRMLTNGAGLRNIQILKLILTEELFLICTVESKIVYIKNNLPLGKLTYI